MKKEIEPTYRECIEQVIETLQSTLRCDTYDWTTKYAQSGLKVSIDYLQKAIDLIDKK